MVEISLRKAKNNWKNVTGTSPSKNNGSSASLAGPSSTDSSQVGKHYHNQKSKDKDKTKKKKKQNANPYGQLDASYIELPTINAREKNKAASSMQRRLSVHTQNYIPPTLDYSMPLPSFNGSENIETTSRNNKENAFYYNGNNSTMSYEPSNQDTSTIIAPQRSSSPVREPINDLFQLSVLRDILSDPNFNTKRFVHERLSTASAIDIDTFTTTLTGFSERIQTEVKNNLNKSYSEIIQVNDGLFIASNELKTLRQNFKNLMEVMSEFDEIARKRLTVEQNENQRKSGLLPPVSNQKQRRDRSSVLVLDKIWKEELSKLVGSVEGSKNVVFENGKRKNDRRLILESSEWVELNVTTSRFLQMVKFYLLNDLIIVASRNKNNDLTINQCLDLKTINVTKESNTNRLLFKTDTTINRLNNTNDNNIRNISNGILYEARDENECYHMLENIRKAKDDLCDIFQSEMENEKRIKESFRYLQSSQQTPNADKYNTMSPTKSNRRSMITSMTPKRISRHISKIGGLNGSELGGGVSTIVNSFSDQHLLQSLTLSMHSNQMGNNNNSISRQLKMLDDAIEEVNVQIARLKFDEAVDTLSAIQEKLNLLYEQSSDTKNDDNNNNNIADNFSMLYNLLMLKINQRKETIGSKLSQSIVFDNEISKLLNNVEILIKLGMKEQSLDLFLQNRSNAIQNLTLKIGSFDSPVNYLTQLAVIRFQTIKQTILNFEKVFPQFINKDSLDNKFSSILVNWCSEEVDKHFNLIDKQLLNDEMLSPTSIKSTREQIDELKTVGLDFVYKLDEFIKKNNHMIR